jgi:hypothetical protein
MDPVSVAVGAAVGTQVAEFVKRAAGPLADEIGQLLRDKVREYRSKNAVQAVNEAERQLRETGKPVQEVPPRTLLPILEGASLEDDPLLATKWASLLANAALGYVVRPIYASILSQLSPADAKVLEVIDEMLRLPPEDPDGWGVSFNRLATVLPDGLKAEAQTSIDTLRGLGLVHLEPSVRMTTDGAPILTKRDGIALSSLARDFLRACRPPRSKGE